jgi:hypothetical protein
VVVVEQLVVLVVLRLVGLVVRQVLLVQQHQLIPPLVEVVEVSHLEQFILEEMVDLALSMSGTRYDRSILRST